MCQHSSQPQSSFCTGTAVNDVDGNSNGNSEVIFIDPTDPPKEGHEIQIDIMYDAKPTEVAWIFVNTDTEETIGVVRYGTATIPSQEMNLRYPKLPSGNYMFLITDSNGDGICCSSGTGWIVISEVNEDGSTNILWADDGRFGDGVTANFALVTPDTAATRDLDNGAP